MPTQGSAASEQLRELTGHALIVLRTRADGERRPGWGLPPTGFCTRPRTQDDSSARRRAISGTVGSAGPSLFDGYLGRDANRDAGTDDEWFITGDLAVIDERGFHRIAGSESVDLIKSSGYRIGACEIEKFLRSIEGVAETAVISAPDDDLGQRIVAYIIIGNGTYISPAIDFENELIAHVANKLSWHKRERYISLTTSPAPA